MITFRNTTTVASFALLVAALASSSGCMKASDWKPSKLFSVDNAWPWGDELEEGTPVRVVGAWTDTVLTKPGQKPQRGFGGRLAFYGPESKKSILVDGQLVVYAFDEAGREPTDNKPTRRYVFPPDQMQHHMSESELGATYSFWLPWDEAGGPKTEVSLICRFEPQGGSVVTSEQTRHLLPGSISAGSAITEQRGPKLPEGEPSVPMRPTLESVRADQRRDSSTQMASFESSGEPHVATTAGGTVAAPPQPVRKMDVTTIALPDNFQPREVAAYLRSSMPATPAINQPIQPGQQIPPAAPQKPATAAPPASHSAMPPTMNGAYATQPPPAAQLGGMAGTYMQQPPNPQNMTSAAMRPSTHNSFPNSPPPQAIHGSQAMTTRSAMPFASMSGAGVVTPTGQAVVPGQQPGTYPQQPLQKSGQPISVPQELQPSVSYPPTGAYPQGPAG